MDAGLALVGVERARDVERVGVAGHDGVDGDRGLPVPAPRGDPAAALDAGFVRFRPVLMTALAMIIGMTPMALGLGEGGEQNAPLGRAVIGGLLFATVSTLLFVPVLYAGVHERLARRAARRGHGAIAPVAALPLES